MAYFGGSGLSTNLLLNTRTQIMCPQPRHQDSDNLLSPGVGHLDGSTHAVVGVREVGSAARHLCLTLEELRRICGVEGIKV